MRTSLYCHTAMRMGRELFMDMRAVPRPRGGVGVVHLGRKRWTLSYIDRTTDEVAGSERY
jgi:hypothetical protein